MRYLLIPVIVLLITPFTYAGLIDLSVNGSTAPDTIGLAPSETVTLDITVNAIDPGIGGFDILIELSNAQGALDASSVWLETDPVADQYFGVPFQMWVGPQPVNFNTGVINSTSTSLLISGGNLYWNAVGGNTDTVPAAWTLMDGLVFHCTGITGVQITMTAFTDIKYYEHDSVGNVTAINTLFTAGTVLDSINVVPEPATLLLLGAGALILRRRRTAAK